MRLKKDRSVYALPAETVSVDAVYIKRGGISQVLQQVVHWVNKAPIKHPSGMPRTYTFDAEHKRLHVSPPPAGAYVATVDITVRKIL